MIKNIPNSSHLLNIGRNCISKAILNIADSYIEYTENEDEYGLMGVNFEELSALNYLHINTSIVLLHQGMEAYMKALISKDSPFLLIDEPYDNWPVLPLSKDKDFNSLFQIGGAKLIRAFCAVYSKTEVLSTALYELFENIRILRNTIVHADPTNKIDTKVVLGSALRLLKVFEKREILNTVRDNFLSNPLIQNNHERKITFRDKIKALEIIIGKSKLSEHIDFDLKARRYHCPGCSMILDQPNDQYKYVLLAPNETTSNLVECLICGNQHSVIRKDCTQINCLGNVIYTIGENDSLCLTCFNYI